MDYSKLQKMFHYFERLDWIKNESYKVNDNLH